MHLTLIAGLNAILWRLAMGPGCNPEFAASVFPLLGFIPGTIVAAVEPHYAIYCWLLGFGGLLVSRLLSRRNGSDQDAGRGTPGT
jgi:hypothetical protein